MSRSIRLLREAHPRAAREHTCTLCLAPIHRGEAHLLLIAHDGDALLRSEGFKCWRLHTPRCTAEVCDE